MFDIIITKLIDNGVRVSGDGECQFDGIYWRFVMRRACQWSVLDFTFYKV